MIVDTHVHIWEMPPVAPIGRTAPRWDSEPDESGTAELLLDDMDQNGVDYTVLVQTSWSTWDNGYLADSARKYPDRFVAHGLLDPLDKGNAQKAIYWMDERDLKGFRFHPMYYDVNDSDEGEILSRPENEPVFRAIQERSGIIQVHCYPEHVPQVQYAVSMYSGITWLIDHMMYPVPRMADDGWRAYLPVLALSKYPNVMIKISDVHNRSQQKFPYIDMHPVVQMAFEKFGPKRCLWGTGYPGHHRNKNGWPTLSDELRLVREGFSFLNEKDRRYFLGDNAASLWGLD